MATIETQSPRELFDWDYDDLRHALGEMSIIADDFDTDLATVVRAARTLDNRRKDKIAVQDGDYRDEQAHAFYKMLESSLEGIRYAIL